MIIMDLFQMPVTLVVKAPNQKMADHTVECDLGWTIRKLKKHLEDVYPSKPKDHQQRIIYAGQLLQDDLVLKDILRRHTEDQTVHTVHLVCSNPPNSSSSTSISSQSSSSQPSHSSSSETSSSSSSGAGTDTEGLRHRNVTESQHVNTAIPQYYQQQFPGGDVGFNGADAMGGMVPGMAPYTPEQMMWFQQMYAQQWAQYVQSYYGIQQPQIPGAVNAEADTPEAVVQQEPRAANQRPANGNQVRMNAQGGGVFEDDDDDENLNRDWLDWVYALCRFLVLLSILYFYSTFGRFVVVFGLFILAYMYQAGWFRINRRNDVPERRREERQPEPAPVEPVEPQNDQQQQNVENETEEAPRQPEAPAPPGLLIVAWSFLTTFFTSLVPQAPPAVNGN